VLSRKLYHWRVEYASEILDEPAKWSVSKAVKPGFVPASQTIVSADRSHGSVAAGLELDLKPAWDARCLWCDRTFSPRMTGGSAQRFCSTGHRQQFWIAARRWTMRAIEVGLLSVDCLKASHTSVHAVRGALT
jgi:hypothetical protein